MRKHNNCNWTNKSNDLLQLTDNNQVKQFSSIIWVQYQEAFAAVAMSKFVKISKLKFCEFQTCDLAISASSFSMTTGKTMIMAEVEPIHNADFVKEN